MLTPDQFQDLADRVEAAGFPRSHASLIGDTPLTDEAGDVLVIEDGEIIATIPSSALQPASLS